MSAEPLIHNAADDEQLGAAKQKKHLADKEAENRWKRAMDDEGFVQCLLDIVRDCKPRTNPMAATDRETYFRIGRQAVGNHILAKMSTANRKRLNEIALKHGVDIL